MHGFSKQLPELDVMVRRMITESFGIEKYIEEHINSKKKKKKKCLQKNILILQIIFFE